MNRTENGEAKAILTEENLRKVITLFCLDMPSGHIVKATGIPLSMVEGLLTEVRKKLAERCSLENPLSKIHLSDLELDNELQVLGVVRQGKKMYMEPVPGLNSDLLEQISRREDQGRKVLEAMGINKKYCGLIPIQGGYAMEITNGQERSENFWKMVEKKFPLCLQAEKAEAYLHLKECEFRHNYPLD